LKYNATEKSREKTINHTGTRIGTTACQLEEKLNITGSSLVENYHLYVQLLQTWKEFHQVKHHIKIYMP